MMLVTLMVLFGQMLDSTTKSGMVSQATFLADKVIETEISRVQGGGAVPPPVREGRDLLYSQDEKVAQEFVYSIDTLPVGLLEPRGGLYSVDVTVKWWTPQDQVRTEQKNRFGMGKLSVTRNRIVYIQRPE
jgi:hypothetical protein